MPSARPVALGLLGGMALDLAFADPVRGHPVAAFGRLAGAGERAVYRDSRMVGTGYVSVLLLATTGVAALLDARLHAPRARAAVVAAVTWSVLGGTSLRREATRVGCLLAENDLPRARRRLSSLCGRDADLLDREGVARAVVESVAENTADAAVGCLLWGAVGGLPGLVAYRALNTLDAMIGHHSPRYERFGWAAARADDAANLLPARLTALLTVALAPLVGGRPRSVLATWRRDGRKHPSPNAGPVEAAFAGALGRTLGGRLAYAGRVEERPLLGDGPGPEAADIALAARLSLAVQLAAAGLVVAVRSLLEAAGSANRGGTAG